MNLNELLGIDPLDPLDGLARRIIHEDLDLGHALRTRRILQGLSVEEVAKRMGTTPDAVASVEGGDATTTLRRYALAVGILIEHTATTVIDERARS